MRDKHLKRLNRVYPYQKESANKYALSIPEKDKEYVGELIKNEIGNNKFVVVGPGAADEIKRWTIEGFAFVCDKIIENNGIKIVFIGDADEDKKVVELIAKLMKNDSIDLSGRINLIQLAELFKHCLFTIVNDSAPMHLASYLNVPVLGIFGPTDPKKYGPWSSHSHFLNKSEYCSACSQRGERSGHTCMDAISSKDVLKTFEITDQGVIFKKF